MKACRVAFAGAGAVAHYHAYALAALKFYYRDHPDVHLVAVTSATGKTREAFAARYGFEHALSSEDLWKRTDVDTVYILGPNGLHYSHLASALSMPGVRQIYVEKPLCSTEAEERAIAGELLRSAEGKSVQVGFQFLQMSPVRRARLLWQQDRFGDPITFQASYLHSGYLDPGYRRQRAERLKPTPEGGALGDLGSHALSLLAAFLGDGLEVLDAVRGPRLSDVPPNSDLSSIVLCRDRTTGAVGTVTASRVSCGAGEVLEVEIRCTRGGFKFTTERPETLEVFPAAAGEASILDCASDFEPHSQFPHRTCSAGWLRAFVHASYLFLSGSDGLPVPGLQHGLAVQRLLREATCRIAAHG